jgi:hypothetical protein
MALKEWDPEEETLEEAEKKAKDLGLKVEESDFAKPEDAPELESFLEIIEDEDDDEDDDKKSAIPDDDDEEPVGKKKPSRSERRIDQLTAQREAEKRRAEEAERRAAATEARLKTLEGNHEGQQLEAFRAQYSQTVTALKRAAEEGDTDKQVELTEKIADMRASARIMDMQRANRPAPQAPREEKTPPPPQAMKWWNENRWFNSPGTEIETQAARMIDANLDSEGYDKNSSDYYEELDKRLQEKFPKLYSTSPTKQKPRGPTTPTRGNTKGSRRSNDGRLRFTRDELAMAKQLGFTTPEELKAYRNELDRSA